jgi:hypothetical protein
MGLSKCWLEERPRKWIDSEVLDITALREPWMAGRW